MQWRKGSLQQMVLEQLGIGRSQMDPDLSLTSFLKNIYLIYLAAPGLTCGTQDL